MQFDAATADAVKKRVAEYQSRGDQRSPVDTPIALDDPNFWAYWISKSQQPMEIAKRGSGLEAHFMRETGNHFILRESRDDNHQELTLSFVGDLMATPGLLQSRSTLYEEVADLIFSADIRCGNLESTLTTQSLAPLSFRMHDAPAVNVSLDEYRVLTEHRGIAYNVLQLANNHMLDHGLEGVETTVAQLQQDGIKAIGVNMSPGEMHPSPTITKIGGFKIGWVAHTFSVNFKPFPNTHPKIVNMTPFHLENDPDLSGLLGQIADCRSKNCDFIVAALHWGLEFELYPHPDQLVWARKIADAGADMVVGHHPHVVQPVEIYTPPDGRRRRVPIIYSLGNLTPVFSHPSNASSLVARLTIGGPPGECRPISLDLTPVALLQAQEEGDESLKLYPLAQLLHMGTEIADPNYVAEMARYIDIVLGDEWRSRD